MDKFSNIKKTHKVIKKQKVNKINESSIVVEKVELTPTEAFFSKLFESREMAHIYHLQTKGEEGSYAKHMALGSYYEDVIELVDDIYEIYIGQYGPLNNYNIIKDSEKETDPIIYFENLSSYITDEKNKAIEESDTHLHSIIDDILCLVYKTLFKLKYNK